ncbi:dephospho-CoA kinase [Rhodoligotrophos appendicifer]|uniref:dephospho-CoA kinase n=1 Tax=Rhodoligotrophos appendicifer TaxID=987056 RepID=UPI0011808F23|nr:dephospho-CoA kinase [Rhodoligotrophos appendicifer]
MKVVALTGSIAMGKSATADMFRRLDVPVFDADSCVHALYARGGRAVEPVGALFPTVIRDGAVDRDSLGKLVLGDSARLKALEAIVHPLVREEQLLFLERAKAEGEPLVVLDIPLFYETRRGDSVDAVVVVSAPSDIQRKRALSRPGMTEEKLDSILSRQVPDQEKRTRADFIVDSSRGLEDAFEQVRRIVQTLRSTDGTEQSR